MQSSKAIKELKQKKKLPEIILEFMPNSTFEEEFLEWVETVLSWGKENEKSKNRKSKK